LDQVTNPENNLLLTTVRKFLEKEILPYEEEVDKIGEVSLELGKQIETRSKQVGLFAAN
jgi:acyl-CoA dehydrogenase